MINNTPFELNNLFTWGGYYVTSVVLYPLTGTHTQRCRMGFVKDKHDARDSMASYNTPCTKQLNNSTRPMLSLLWISSSFKDPKQHRTRPGYRTPVLARPWQCCRCSSNEARVQRSARFADPSSCADRQPGGEGASPICGARGRRRVIDPLIQEWYSGIVKTHTHTDIYIYIYGLVNFSGPPGKQFMFNHLIQMYQTLQLFI